MFLEEIFVPGLNAYSYVIGCEEANECVVIDPFKKAEAYLAIAKKRYCTITHIILTHTPLHHATGALELKEQLDSKPEICCSGMITEDRIPDYADKLISDGDTLQVCNLILKALHTPGISAENLSFIVYDRSRNINEPYLMFTGNFLCTEDIGEPDIYHEDERELLYDQLYRTIFERLAPLPDYIELKRPQQKIDLCNHNPVPHPSTTLGYQRKTNPLFQKREKEIWITALKNDKNRIPYQCKAIYRNNLSGDALTKKTAKSINALTLEQAVELMDEGVVAVDLRSTENYAKGHLKKAVHIPFCKLMPTFALWSLNPSDRFILIAENEDLAYEALKEFSIVGYDTVIGFIPGDMAKWKQENIELSELETVTVDDLAELLEKNHNKVVILDVRSDTEWRKGHIPGAVHYQLQNITSDLLNEVSPDQNIYLVCNEGIRSAVMASKLQSYGFAHVKNTMGGMSEWEKRHHPLEEGENPGLDIQPFFVN